MEDHWECTEQTASLVRGSEGGLISVSDTVVTDELMFLLIDAGRR
jgi:hypothetical protein